MATYKFYPPTRQEGPGVPFDQPWYVKRLFPTRSQGISLVKDESGLFVEQRVLTEEHYGGKVNGVDFFVGGYRYTGITQEVADILIASGFGDRLEEE